jgi:hypothetical protein
MGFVYSFVIVRAAANSIVRAIDQTVERAREGLDVKIDGCIRAVRPWIMH